ncbi:MAG: ATP-binding protein [Planctomycetota bacterium]|jgi:anti-sigma regulatory factor (Ser/Thr protein kinase)
MPTVLIADPADDSNRLLATSDDLRIVLASNAGETVERMEELPVDAMLVDVALWRDDGFRASIRRTCTYLPVIVLTEGHESCEETLGLLRLGAVSFVPRPLAERELAETVASVLALAGRDAARERLAGCLVSSESTFLIENDLRMIPILVGHLQDAAEDFGVCDRTARVSIGVALREAISNAIIHGNLEISSELRAAGGREYYELVERRSAQPPYGNRRVTVTARLTGSAAAFVIRDEGSGFDLADVPDPTDPGQIESVSGRGILLMQAYMDLVSWNEIGNEVTMIKRVEG